MTRHHRSVLIRTVVLLCLAMSGGLGEAFEAPALDIVSDPSGVFRATAVLHIPAPHRAVRAVLTDYDRWPVLFNGRFRIAELRREADRVVTDLMITRSPFPGELRLFCETRESPSGLVTTGLEGDFTGYVRRWTLTPEPRQETSEQVEGTRAEMELSFGLRAWMPAWLVKEGLRQELLEHFDTLYELAVKETNHPR